MSQRIYQVDAFTDIVFGGNPAAVMPLDTWLPDRMLQDLAAENNLAETAFFVPEGQDGYRLRWFTPDDRGRSVRPCHSGKRLCHHDNPAAGDGAGGIRHPGRGYIVGYSVGRPVYIGLSLPPG